MNSLNIALVKFNYFHCNTVLGQLLQQTQSGFVKETTPHITDHSWLDLPDSIDSYSKSLSKNSRNINNRLRNRINREFADRWRIEKVHKPEHYPRLIDDMEQVASQSYHRNMGIGFHATDDARSKIQWSLGRGEYLAYIIYFDDQPVSFWSGRNNGDTYFIEDTAFLDQYSYHGPGRFLFLHIVEDLIANGFKRFDIGMRGAQYKYQLCNHFEPTMILHLFDKNQCPRHVYWLFNALGKLTQTIKNAVESDAFKAIKTKLSAFKKGKN